MLLVRNFKVLMILMLVFFMALLIFDSRSDYYQSERSKISPDKDIHRLELIKQKNKVKDTKKFNEKLKVFNKAKVIDEKNLEFFKLIQRHKYEIDCKSIMEWDEAEARKAKRLLYQLRINNGIDYRNAIPLLPDSNFIFDRSVCSYFRSIRGYNNYTITRLEEEFPIAFSILTYENVEQFERLLRIIYRPQNAYCIQ